jgi:protein SCO1
MPLVVALAAITLAAAPPPDPLQVGFDQKLGGQVPLDLVFRDEEGRTVRLGDLFGGRPVILSLAYYDCPMLCGLSLQGIASSLKTLSFDAGREFEVVTVSFNPKETPAQARAKKIQSLDLYGRPGLGQGWRFLTGDAEPIRRLTEAVGFRYAWDEEQKQYAHPTGIVLLTPTGRIARYLFGVEYAPKDLRLGLVEAADNRIGTLADRLLLLCYAYDPKTGRYSGLAITLVRTGGVVTLLVLGACIAVAVRRDKRRGAERASHGRVNA